MTALNSKVLVLNKSCRPVDITTAKEAFVLLFKGVAEVVDVQGEQYDFHNATSWEEISKLRAEYEQSTPHKWVSRVSDKLVIPKIVRLISYNKDLSSRRTRFSRNNIYIRDDNTCQYCSREFSRENLNLDHVIPRSRGGKTTWENIVTSCISCNTKKANRTPEEAGMRLIKKPVKFRYTVANFSKMDSSWRPFLNMDDALSDAYWNVELGEN